MGMRAFFGAERRASVQRANGRYCVWLSRRQAGAGHAHNVEVYHVYKAAIEAARRFCARTEGAQKHP